ncbi:MAG: DUF6101 family protein [Rhizobiaceae bacterium]
MVKQATQENAGNPAIAPKPVWAGRHMRLDPYSMPHRLEMDVNDLSYSIDRQGAVMKRTLTCGLPVSMALPVRSFKGVAARAIENADGSVTVTLELHHHDADLCVPLLVSDDLDDIAADWHAWSRLLRLPMLIVGADSKAVPVRQQLGEIMVDPAYPRRKRFSTLKHRPWFLRRRKPGVIGEIVKISGEELIARR